MMLPIQQLDCYVSNTWHDKTNVTITLPQQILFCIDNLATTSTLIPNIKVPHCLPHYPHRAGGQVV
jgi:hypothetical protein